MNVIIIKDKYGINVLKGEQLQIIIDTVRMLSTPSEVKISTHPPLYPS